MSVSDEATVSAQLSAILAKHPDVPGVSVAISRGYKVYSAAAGFAKVSTTGEQSGIPLTTDHFLQCASLSKTVGTAFAIEYFTKCGIPMTHSVKALLDSIGSSWRIICNPSATNMDASAGDRVTLAMLVNHTALGMHYVYGIPHSSRMPSCLELISGSAYTASFGYQPLLLERAPGERFAYSGGGFLVMQHIIETMEGSSKSINEICADFCMKSGMKTDMKPSFTFAYDDLPDTAYAWGHLTKERLVQPNDHGRLKFPSFAAGAMGTPTAMLQFLCHLAMAYKCPVGSGGISQQTAQLMLGEASLQDKGAVEFMRAKVISL